MGNKKAKTKYKVRILETSEADLWDDFVDRSQNGTLFHKYGWMKAAEQQSNTHLYPLVCEKDGEGIISVFPGFVSKVFFLRLFFSPPPSCSIPELGPVFSFRSSKQYKIESDLQNIIEVYDSFIRKEVRPDYINIMTNLYDVRSFKWLDYFAEPAYTYRLPLADDTNVIFSNFKDNIRNMIKKIQKNDNVEIRVVGPKRMERFLDEIRNRYIEQNKKFKLSNEYVYKLFNLFGDKQLKFYECVVDDQYQTSFINLEYRNNMKFWLGGVHRNNMMNGVIETIHWNNIINASKRSFLYYENIGANTKHLCENKSRYGFHPEVYYKVEKWSTAGRAFHYAYENLLRKNSNRE